uniref:Uncharacterized protein n=1 Tax=uncultured marine virus TaxID=186617 RepID=A0A0F7L7T5_9VIRU|nr:hypothetical protein [uncultured marine virus]
MCQTSPILTPIVHFLPSGAFRFGGATQSGWFSAFLFSFLTKLHHTVSSLMFTPLLSLAFTNHCLIVIHEFQQYYIFACMLVNYFS